MDKQALSIVLIFHVVAVMCTVSPVLAREDNIVSTNGLGSVLACSLTTNRFSIGDHIVLALSLTNSVEGVVQTSANPVFGTYKIKVSHADGRSVALTETGKMALSYNAFRKGERQGPLRLRKGESVAHRIEVASLFDMTDPGEYRIDVSTSFVRIKGEKIIKGELNLPTIPILIIRE